MRILAVDDHPSNLKVLAALLEAKGHVVLPAGNGVEALEILGREPVDVIISDILMPQMDGYRLCHEVRRDERWRRLPFIFYTATYTSPSDEKLCYELGADQYLRKPAAPEAILAALDEATRSPGRVRPPVPQRTELEVLKEYNERLVNRLEQKNLELSAMLKQLTAREAELQRNERKLRLIIEHSPAAVAMLDRDLRYTLVSRRWNSDYRLGEEDVIGRRHYDVFPDIPQRWKDVHRRCLAGAFESCDEDQFPRADGTTDWVRWEVRPWRDAQGDIGGLILFSEVITERKRTEAALRNSEEHFRALFEQAGDAIMLCSRDLTCRNVNARGCELLGYPRAELIGLNVSLLVTKPDRAGMAPELANVAAGRPYRKEWKILRKDGAAMTVELSVAPLADGNLILIARDITERKRTEAELRLQSAALTAAANAIVITDRDGSIDWVNPAFTALTGYMAAEAVGQNPRDLVKSGTQDRGFYQELWETICAGRVWRGELVNRRKDGSLYSEEQTITPVRDPAGRITNFVAIKQDLTERKRAEAALRQANVELERKVAERTADLLQAKERAEAADQHKSQFLANMSHELRTPLNAIIGFAGTLLMRLPGPLNAEQAEQLTIVQDSARHLLSLINDLLDLAKIEAGKVQVRHEPVACQPLLEEIVAMMRPLVAKKGLRLDYQAPAAEVRVVADSRALKQIVLNLCNNAVKFTDAGSVTLTLEETAGDGTRAARFTVADTGAGIPPEFQARLFQAFAQLGGAHREGTGLGLHLSRKLAQLIGGQIGFESEYGRGSRFWLTLPMN